MRVAIAVGSYLLTPFVRLNLAQINTIWPDAPVLVSDDRSVNTEAIEAIAQDAGACFITSGNRRGHCGAKVQSIVSGLSFAQQEGADILLFLNQRFVPIHLEFREFIESPFADAKTHIVVAGRTTKSQIKLPASKYFNGLGLLTDVLAIRVNSISPADLLKAYTDGFKHGGFFIGLLIEPFLGKLLGSFFKDSAYVSSALSDANTTTPTFFRREQTPSADYQALAAQHGFSGEFDVRDWLEIEPRTYRCRPELTT